ncbi:MAG: hypothetical protein HOL31_01910 [Candidatus Scalindua sp.]|nr:hypothetical protein [Candidatus Scalindua sp.]
MNVERQKIDEKAFSDNSTWTQEFVGNLDKLSANATILFNALGLVSDADASKFTAEHSVRLHNAQIHAPEYMKNLNADLEKVEGFLPTLGVLLKHPKALPRMALTQTANSLVPIGLGFVGAVAGNAVVPVAGSFPGFLAGSYAGEAFQETSAWMDQVIQKKGIDMTDAKQVIKVLNDDAFMSDLLKEAGRKGLSQAAISTIFNLLTGRVLSGAGKTLTKKATRFAGGVGLQSIEEGVGEAGGQLAAVGEVEGKDIALETVLGGIGAGANTFSIGMVNKALGKESVREAADEKEDKEVSKPEQKAETKKKPEPERTKEDVSESDKLLEEADDFFSGEKKTEKKEKGKEEKLSDGTKVQDKVDKIISDIKSLIPTEEVKGRGIGEVNKSLSFTDNVTGFMTKAVQVAKQKFIALTPMNVVFDLMSNTKEIGKGKIFQTFKKPVDALYSKFQNESSRAKENVLKMITAFNLNASNFERIAIAATLEQKGGRVKLESNPEFEGIEEGKFSAAELDKFEKAGLNDEEKTVLEAMRKVFENIKPELKRVLEDTYGRKFADVDDFFPMLANFDAMEDFDIAKMFDINVATSQELRGISTLPFKERTGAATPIKLDAKEVFLKHVDTSLYLVTMGEAMSDLQKIAANKDFRNATGKFGSDVIDSWLKLMQKNGGVDSKRIKALDWLRDNAGMAILGFKLSTVAIQPTAALDAAAIIGPIAVYRGMHNYLLNKDWRTFIRENFIEIRNRQGDDPALSKISNNEHDNSKFEKFKDAAFWGIRTVDGITAASVAAGAYEKFVTERGGKVDFSNPDAEGIAHAEEIVNRTQGSALAKDSPAAISQARFFGNRSIDKAFFQFQTFALTRFSLITSALSQNQGSFVPNKHTINVAIYLTMAAMASSVARVAIDEFLSLLPGDDNKKDEDIIDNAVSKFVREMVSFMPVTSNVIGPVFYKSTSIPAIDMVVQSANRIGIALDAKGGEKKLLEASRAVIKITGTLGFLPGASTVDDIVEETFRNNKRRSSRKGLKRL